MTRSEFEAFLTRLVWRTGDTPFETDLEYLIRMGQTRLNRDLLVRKRIVRTTLNATSQVITLPDDYDSVLTLKAEDGRQLTYVTPHDMEGYTVSDTAIAPYFTILDALRVADYRITAANPETFDLTYYSKLPEYTTDETWVQRDHFDLYLHACLIYTAPYLREDERLQTWQTLYGEMLASALSANAREQYSGSPLKPRLPGVVA